MRPAIPAIFLSLLAAAPALAQNASTAGSVELYPTYHAVGVRLAYTGDANANAGAHLEWRVSGGATWTRGVPMTRITSNRWAGSVLWLAPNANYEVRAVIDDPDGGGSASGTAHTRAMPNLIATGRTWWVATNGNDANPGTSSLPLATIQAAVSRVQAGEEVRVRPGIYYQTVDAVAGGTASALVHIIADGPGVILDGSDPAFLSRSDWRNDGSGVFSVPYAPTAQRVVVADSLQRLYKQASLSALQANANGVSQGFAIEGGRLYVKLEDRSSPVGHIMHVARYNVGFFVDAPYWHVEGFEIRNFGLASGGSGVRLSGSVGSVIRRNYIHLIGNRCVFLNSLAADNLIEGNMIRDPRISTWPWSAVKAHEEEDSGVSNRGGRGNVIRWNDMRGNFNGVDEADGTTNENVGADCDIYGNVMVSIGDDALETDDISGINVRIWQNRADQMFDGQSVAPNLQGPEYILYNTYTNFTRSAFKLSISSSGETWICHNTAASNVSGATAMHPSGPYSNKRFRNNILMSTNTAPVSDDAGESGSGCDFDGDLLYAPGSSTLFRWKGVNYSSLSAIQSGTGYESHGRSGNPLFVNTPLGDYMLRTGSPAIDGGVRLPGINDLFVGAAPDIGAFEFGGTDAIRPAAITDLR